MSQNRERNLPEVPAIHSEHYANQSVYLQRMERLNELGYTGGLSCQLMVLSDFQTIIDDMILTLASKQFDLVQITSPTHFSLMYRTPDSKLPTAREDFDQPAGADAITEIATSALPDTTQQRAREALSKLITDTRQQIEKGNKPSN